MTRMLTCGAYGPFLDMRLDAYAPSTRCAAVSLRRPWLFRLSPAVSRYSLPDRTFGTRLTPGPSLNVSGAARAVVVPFAERSGL